MGQAAGNYIGLLRAKRDEEINEFAQSRNRAQTYLRTCKPDYIKTAKEDILLGLKPVDDDDEESDSDASNPFQESESSSDPAEDLGDGGGKARTEEQEKEKEDSRKMKEQATLKLVEERKALLVAASKGQRRKVQQFCASKTGNINYRDRHGRSALYLAAEKGQPRALEALLKAQAKVENPNENGWTPLHAATFHGQVTCMDELILSGAADLNAKDNYECTPLILAASSPKLYLTDLVSKADRKKLVPVRNEILEFERKQGKKKEELSLKNVPPEEWWTHYPTRLELIVINRLLLAPGKVGAKRCVIDQYDKKQRTPLMYAARFGRTYAVSRLLAAKADQQRKDRDGRTPIMSAASNEHYETVELLLMAGSTVNCTDHFFSTPLHGALEKGDEPMTKLLLEASASVNVYDCEGRTPILLAMDQKNRRLFAEIVNKRSNLDVLDKRGWNVVIYAIESGMLKEIEPLLSKLGDRAKLILRNVDPEGKNSMHHAVDLEDMRQAEKDVDIICRLDSEAAIYGDCNGDTPIHYAAQSGRLDILRMLVKDMQYADRDNDRGETPLHYAAHSGHLACVVALVDCRNREPLCDAGIVDKTGRSLLMHACVSGHLDLCNMLLQNREGDHPYMKLPQLDVNHQDTMGVTALSTAAREGQWHLLPSLVIAGANLMAKDNDGFTALHWAATEDEALCTSCLMDLAADPDSIDAKGWTSLMHAVARGCDEVVRVLVDCGTNLDVRNWDGDTAIQICARRRDAKELVQITTDILTDGMLEIDNPARHSIEAKGHFVVSVLDALDLYMEGKVGEMNTYVCLQLRTMRGGSPFVAFTSCVKASPSPEWHEVFRFDTENLDPSACLVAWVIAAPGDDDDQIIAGAEHGLSEEQLQKLKQAHLRSGVPLVKNQPDFNTAMQTAFNRLTKKADRNEDQEVARLRKLAMAQSRGCEPTMDLVVPAGRAHMTMEQRRWEDVSNLRALLERSGCEIQDPLVPRTHLPLGCVVMRFRQLREAVWGLEPVQISRTLRLNCRGNLRLELDFRPTFFKPKTDPRVVQMSSQEEEEIYSVRPLDPEDDSFDGLALLQESKGNMADPMKKQLEDYNRFKKGRGDPYKLYRRYKQVMQWSSDMIETAEEEQILLRERKHKFEKRTKPPEGEEQPTWQKRLTSAGEAGRVYALDAAERYKQQQKTRKDRSDAMDRPVGAPPPPPPPAKTQKENIAAIVKQRQPQFTYNPDDLPTDWPKLKVEPWMQDLLETSRFM